VGTPLCEGVTLRFPIVQAPLGACDGPRLAAAVSRAGGMGCLSVHNLFPDAARRRIAYVRRRTSRPFLLALTAQWEPESVLDACVAAGVRCFQVFWWNGPRLAPRVRAAGGQVFWQVGTPEEAADAVAIGAHVLVAQGTEAGGQVRGPVPLADLIPALLPLGLPVVAGGGLAARADVARALAWGARAAMLGTRFIASEESAAPPAYKRRILRARPDDLILDTRLAGSWPCAPRRRIGAAPRGEADDETCWYAGLGVGRIRSLLPAARIVRALAAPRVAAAP
jgi:NAD(P)H-dependent flavin oxidoreductase YrpB (nitropropane dioxygenase family)